MAAIAMVSPPKLFTQIPNYFIDEYMPAANPLFSIVLIYFCRLLQNNPAELTTEAIADKFEILETDVLRIFEHWQKTGLLKFEKIGDAFSVELLFDRRTEANPAGKAQKPEKPKKPAPVLLETRPVYSQAELELYQNESSDIQRLFAAGEKTLGKLLQYSDLTVLFGLYDWLRLPVDVIEVLLDYCAENDHRHLNYIEKVGITWAENNLRTVEDAKAFIQTYNRDFREILKALGQSGREPAPSQLKYMKKWLELLPLPIILEACDRAVMQGQGKFPYVDKIIARWAEAGLKTVEEIEASEAEYRKTASETKENGKETKKSPKTNRFANFKQRDWDEDKLKKLDTLYLE